MARRSIAPRSRFTVETDGVIHECVNPWTGEQETRRYWIPSKGGYVYLDDSKKGNQPGTLGRQPHTNGTTWRAVNVADLVALVKREWRRERRDANNEI